VLRRAAIADSRGGTDTKNPFDVCAPIVLSLPRCHRAAPAPQSLTALARPIYTR